ncbi:MAG TPA: hypothetical protein VJQ54_09295 [Candidatus Sulfotelmatobacter sp.]|nr:hypothetical protein [Candidatus Sulfotelmatobacter sp.]
MSELLHYRLVSASKVRCHLCGILLGSANPDRPAFTDDLGQYRKPREDYAGCTALDNDHESLGLADLLAPSSEVSVGPVAGTGQESPAPNSELHLGAEIDSPSPGLSPSPDTGEGSQAEIPQGDLVRLARPPALDEDGTTVGTQSVAHHYSSSPSGVGAPATLPVVVVPDHGASSQPGAGTVKPPDGAGDLLEDDGA